METAEHHLDVAEQELRQGHAHAAVDHTRAALRMQPQNARAFAISGLAYAVMGEEIEAREAVTKSCEIAPRDSRVRYIAYLTLGRMRDVSGARGQLTYFCELEPKNEDARAALVRLGGPVLDLPPLPRVAKAAVWYDGTGHAVTDADDFEEDGSDDAEPPPGPDVVMCGCGKRTWKGWFCKYCGAPLTPARAG